MPVCDMKKTEWCYKCGKYKLRSGFSKCTAKKNGLQSSCKLCKRKWSQSPAGHESNKKNRSTLRGYLQQVYRDIVHRCTSKKFHAYHRYGGRGIKNLFLSSEDFMDYVLTDLEIGDAVRIMGLRVDRINNDGHYERGNIRFVTHKENCNNKEKKC
jgi:hypothetical protein